MKIFLYVIAYIMMLLIVFVLTTGMWLLGMPNAIIILLNSLWAGLFGFLITKTIFG